MVCGLTRSMTDLTNGRNPAPGDDGGAFPFLGGLFKAAKGGGDEILEL